MAKKMLVAYFSKTGSNYYKGSIIKLDFGNTEKCAQMIQSEFSADLFRVERTSDYPDEYQLCVNEAGHEFNEQVLPPLKENLKNLEDYDVIVVGYPNWYNTMPKPVWTFLSQHNFKDKMILPFCTHEGSGLGTSVKDIKKLCPTSIIKPGLAIKGSQVDQSQSQLLNWVKENSV